MVRKIIWSQKAENDLYEILNYWNERNASKSYSIKLNRLIERQVHLIAEFPFIGRKTDVTNVYLKIILNYLLFYQVTEEIIYLITIVDGRRSSYEI